MPHAETSTLQRYLRTIRRHLGLIVACTAVTLGAALVYVETAAKTYTAEADLLITPASQQNTLLFSLPVLHATGDPTTDVLTAADLITTPQVANGVIQTLHLRTTAPELLLKIQATPVAQSSILAVQATGSSGSEAQRLANAFAQQVIVVRTAALRQALALVIPNLRDTVAALPAAQRGGVGTLGDQLSQLEQLQRGNDPTISIASAASRPTSPTSPRKTLSLAAGLLAGLLIGIGAAFGFDAVDPRLRREEQLRDLAPNVPVVARVPRIGRRPLRRPLTPTELTAPAMEQYRMLRANLSMKDAGHATGRRQRGQRAFLVTGSSPSEGKTTSALGLATVLARGGDSVILIEADLRRPTIANALGLERFTGTADVLAGRVQLADALEDVQLDGAEFRVLAARSHWDADALLSYGTVQSLVESAKQLADRVVIDSPPLTAVIDALPFALVADQCVVVARVGHSRLNRLSELFDLLGRYDREPSGLVLVGVEHDETDLYTYYTDGRSDGEAPVEAPASVLMPSAGGRARRT